MHEGPVPEQQRSHPQLSDFRDRLSPLVFNRWRPLGGIEVFMAPGDQNP